MPRISTSQCVQLKDAVLNLISLNDFIEGCNVQAFNVKSQCFVNDVARLAEIDESRALELLGILLQNNERIFFYVDDPDGRTIAVMRRAVELWLHTAARVRDSKPNALDWMEVVFDYYVNKNSYGCFDLLLKKSAVLLSDNELHALSERFESEVQSEQRALANKDFCNSLAYASRGLLGIAEALQCQDMYQRAELLCKGLPEPLGLERVLHHALKLGFFEGNSSKAL